MQDLMDVANTKFKECLDSWVDLPERVYTESYKTKFEIWVKNYINTRTDIDIKDVENGVISCLHHETGNRTPYIEFNDNDTIEIGGI